MDTIPSLLAAPLNKNIMAYIYLNKETNEYRVFGSIKALCKGLGLKPDNLYTKFNRKALKEVDTDNYKIIKVEIERN